MGRRPTPVLCPFCHLEQSGIRVLTLHLGHCPERPGSLTRLYVVEPAAMAAAEAEMAEAEFAAAEAEMAAAAAEMAEAAADAEAQWVEAEMAEAAAGKLGS